MKVITMSQIKQVSGAGFMADMGWADFGEYLNFAAKNNMLSGDLLSVAPIGGGESDVKESYLAWCDKNGIDAVVSAKNNGWKL